jgi:hypothetical protein
MIIKRTLAVRRLLYGFLLSKATDFSFRIDAANGVQKTTDVWSLVNVYRVRRG